MRQVVLADDDLDVDAEIVRDARGSRSRGPTALAVLREFEHLDVDDHAVQILHALETRAARRPRGRRAAIRGNSIPSGISIHCWMRSSAGTTKLPRLRMRNSPTTVHVARRRMRTSSAFRPAFRASPRDVHEDAIAVHTFGGFVGRQEDVLRHGTADGSGSENRSRRDERISGRPHTQGSAPVATKCRSGVRHQVLLRQAVERVFERIAIFAGEP